MIFVACSRLPSGINVTKRYSWPVILTELSLSTSPPSMAVSGLHRRLKRFWNARASTEPLIRPDTAVFLCGDMCLSPTRCLRGSLPYLLGIFLKSPARVSANQSRMHPLPDFIGKLSSMHCLKMDGWPSLYVSNCSTHFAIIWLRTSTLGYSSLRRHHQWRCQGCIAG